jgi:hypothetical protein
MHFAEPAMPFQRKKMHCRMSNQQSHCRTVCNAGLPLT